MNLPWRPMREYESEALSSRLMKIYLPKTLRAFIWYSFLCQFSSLKIRITSFVFKCWSFMSRIWVYKLNGMVSLSARISLNKWHFLNNVCQCKPEVRENAKNCMSSEVIPWMLSIIYLWHYWKMLNSTTEAIVLSEQPQVSNFTVQSVFSTYVL